MTWVPADSRDDDGVRVSHAHEVSLRQDVPNEARVLRVPQFVNSIATREVVLPMFSLILFFLTFG